MDRLLPRFLAGVVTVMLVRGLTGLPQKEKPNTVELPRWMLFLGLGIGVPTLILSVVLMMRREYDGALLCLCFALPGGALALARCNCCVYYDEDGFTARSFFGVSRRYFYGDITCVLGKDGDIRIYIGKKVVRLDALATGRDTFLSLAKKQYRKAHKGRLFPTRERGSGFAWDLFRGSIDNPREMLTLYVSILALMLAYCLLLVYLARPKPSEWEQKTVSFSSRQTDESQIILYESGYDGHYELARTYLTGEAVLLDAVDRGGSFEVCFSSLSSREKGAFRSIRTLKDSGGSVYLSPEAGRRMEHDAWLSFTALMGAFALFAILFFIFCILVGRYPGAFGPRIVYSFYKKEHVLHDFTHK